MNLKMIKLIVILMFISQNTYSLETLSFNDGELSSANWEVEVRVDFRNTTSSSGIANFVTEGGNPGSRIVHSHIDCGNDYVYAFAFNNSAVVEPTVIGVIDEITIEFDTNMANYNASTWSPAIKQDGKIYLANGGYIHSDDGWSRKVSSNLRAEDFNGFPSPPFSLDSTHPDFSSSGNPITLGYRVSNSRANAGTMACLSNTVTVSVDNWAANVTSISPDGSAEKVPIPFYATIILSLFLLYISLYFFKRQIS